MVFFDCLRRILVPSELQTVGAARRTPAVV